MILASLEHAASSLLGKRDNPYTTESYIGFNRALQIYDNCKRSHLGDIIADNLNYNGFEQFIPLIKPSSV